jgi:hypothetical protein
MSTFLPLMSMIFFAVYQYNNHKNSFWEAYLFIIIYIYTLYIAIRGGE